jgi:hypothetical protein
LLILEKYQKIFGYKNLSELFKSNAACYLRDQGFCQVANL